MLSLVVSEKQLYMCYAVNQCLQYINNMLSLQQSLFGDEPNYFSAGVPASKFPERHFCSVCGYPFYVDIDSEI